MAKTRRHANTNHPKEQHRGVRPTWEGHLRLSLVTCPVALYTATERSADVHFNLINPKTNNRIRMQTVDAGTGDAVERSDLVQGLRGLQEQVRAARQGRARRGEARIDAHHRHRGVRRRRRPSTASTGTSPTTSRPPARPASRPSRSSRRRWPSRRRWRWAAWCCISASMSARSSRATAASCSPPCAATTRSATAARSSTAICPSPMQRMLDIAEKIIEQQEAEVRSRRSSRTATRTRCAS